MTSTWPRTSQCRHCHDLATRASNSHTIQAAPRRGSGTIALLNKKFIVCRALSRSPEQKARDYSSTRKKSNHKQLNSHTSCNRTHPRHALRSTATPDTGTAPRSTDARPITAQHTRSRPARTCIYTPVISPNRPTQFLEPPFPPVRLPSCIHRTHDHGDANGVRGLWTKPRR